MSFRDLFTASRDLFINIKDLLVIFDPTNEISINYHILLPINSPHREEVVDSWPLTHLACSLLTLANVFGEKPPTHLQEVPSWKLESLLLEISTGTIHDTVIDGERRGHFMELVRE